MTDFVICARNVKGQKFGSEPAPSSYLAIEADEPPQPSASQLVARGE